MLYKNKKTFYITIVNNFNHLVIKTYFIMCLIYKLPALSKRKHK